MLKEKKMSSDSEDCPLGVRNETRIINIEKILDRVQNRPPLWVTAGFSAAGLLIGILVTCLVHLT